jgi:hypothetical protein
MSITIMPAWIKSQSDEGVVCVLGSQPAVDAQEVTIPSKDVESVSLSDAPPDASGRRFGVIVYTPKKESNQ